MGIIKDNYLGRLSGKIGDVCYRDFKDKTVVASLPKRNKNDHPNCKAPKKRFGHTSRLASFVNKIPPIKKVWEMADRGSFSAYHSLMRANTNIAAREHLTTKNIISPPGETLVVSEADISDGFIKAHLEIKGRLMPPPLKALMVIYAYDPVGKEEKYFRFYQITTEVKGKGSKAEREFDLIFDAYPFTLNWLSGYRKWIMYFTIIKDDDCSQINWTSTAACESKG